MHDSRRWRLLAYDIRDEKRYRKVHKLLKGYGQALQYSIFRCELDDRQAADLRWQLGKFMDAEDSLLIVDLCPSCAGRIVSQNLLNSWSTTELGFEIAGESAQAPIARRRPRRLVPRQLSLLEGLDDL